MYSSKSLLFFSIDESETVVFLSKMSENSKKKKEAPHNFEVPKLTYLSCFFFQLHNHTKSAIQR